MVNAPNLFTLIRVILIPFVGSAILAGSYGRAIALLFVAGFTDVMDGLLARRFGSTQVGAYFDPLADKTLLAVVYLTLGAARAIPWWMVALVFARDLLILGMAAYGLLFTSIRKFPPSVWGKISTFFQIAAALVVIGDRDGILAPVRLALALMVVATTWSGIHYLWTGLSVLRKWRADGITA